MGRGNLQVGVESLLARIEHPLVIHAGGQFMPGHQETGEHKSGEHIPDSLGESAGKRKEGDADKALNQEQHLPEMTCPAYPGPQKGLEYAGQEQQSSQCG